MLVKVRFGETQKYVKVAQTEEGYEDYNTFLQKGFHQFLKVIFHLQWDCNLVILPQPPSCVYCAGQ